MSGQQRRERRGKAVADGLRAGVERMVDDAGKRMLADAGKTRRVVLRAVPKGPGLLADGVEIATSEDKLRELFGAAGGLAGGFAGGALGVATGPAAPVAAPLGAAAGSVAGEHIAEDIYDRNETAIRRRAEALRRGAGDTLQWMRMRGDQVARDLGNDLQRHIHLPQHRKRF